MVLSDSASTDAGRIQLAARSLSRMISDSERTRGAGPASESFMCVRPA